MSNPHHYLVGAKPKVYAVFRDEDNELIDPTAVSFIFRNPAGDTTTYVFNTNVELVRDSTGKYHVEINANAAGFWHYRYESTGDGQAAFEGRFAVDRSNFS